MKKSEMQRVVLHELRDIFYPKDKEYIDWMGYPITNKNKPSYHHIEKACELKHRHESTEATIENGAYLGKKSHEILHKVECYDYELYECWTYIFEVINNMRIYPIEDVWKMVYSLQDKTKELLYNDNKTLKKKK